MYGVLILSDDSRFLSQSMEFIPNINDKIRVETLNNPSRLKDVLKSHMRVDVVVCDHNPPEIDAFEIFNEMSRINDLRPFIIVTREVDGEAALEASELGMDYYMVRKNTLSFFMKLVPKIVSCTERLRAEEVREIKNRRADTLITLSTMKDRNFSIILDYVLEESVALTKSAIGYIAMYKEAENRLEMAAWSKAGLEQCKMESQQVTYDFDTAGIWGEPIRRGKPIIVNSYQDEKRYPKSGIPVGHVQLNRLLMIPIYYNGKIMATAGLGNKSTEYTSDDVMQFTTLMNGMISVHHEKMQEGKLERDRQEIINLFHDIPVGIMILDDSFTVMAINKHVQSLISYGHTNSPTMSLLNNTDDLSAVIIKDVEKAKVSDSNIESEHSVRIDGKNTAFRIKVSESRKNTAPEYIVVIDKILDTAEKRQISALAKRIGRIDKLIGAKIKEILSEIQTDLMKKSDCDNSTILEKVNRLYEMVVFIGKYHDRNLSEPVWLDLEELLKKASEESGIGEENFELRARGVKIVTDPDTYKIFTEIMRYSKANSEQEPRISVKCELVSGNLIIVYSDNTKGIPNDKKEAFIAGESTEFGKRLFIAINMLNAEGFILEERGNYGEGLELRITIPPSDYSVSWN
ncbi:MAG: GAF domain-containing protein [Candidatus Methanomethylophilaceae archaeon]|jgi:CheY-like chemotaxis protein/DNA-binding ferritin-like protein (Dps family)